MAEENDSQEKSQQATPKRKQDAKKKGQVARSRDLNTMLLLFAAGIMLILSGGNIIKTVMAAMQSAFSLSRESVFSVDSMSAIVSSSVISIFLSLLPFFIALVIVALASPALLGGWSFTAPKFKAEKISFVKGVKRIFSMNSLNELFKSVAKFLLIAGFGVLVIWVQRDELLSLADLPVNKGIVVGLKILGWSFMVLLVSLVIVSAIDVPFQLWNHSKKLKMSLKEVKDEQKDTDGSPEMKQKVRAVQQQMAQRRMMEDLPNASVVITNPTHYAVALRYEDDDESAPILVAKGVDHLAQQIRFKAAEHDITIVEAPALARALFFNTEIGQVIPQGLYVAVAKVLVYIFQLKNYRPGVTSPPDNIDELPIPEELRHDSEQERV